MGGALLRPLRGRLMPDTKRQACICRDCLVETIEGMCQRCRQFNCSNRSDADCKAPGAYALSAQRALK